MNLSKYIACICEGSAEQVIIEILLDNNKLIFNRDSLIEGEVIRIRSGKSFEERYLRKEFSRKITIIRILDSRNEKFNISKAYKEKIDIINIITSPEIEMLVILKENKFKQFKKSKKKPSDFCKEDLGFSRVKNADFVEKYFSDVDLLIKAIKEYKRIAKSGKNEYTLYDLLIN